MTDRHEGTKRSRGVLREVSQGVGLLALTGTSVGWILGMVSLATRVLGR